MIYTVTMYAASCDNCQEDFEATHTAYCAFIDKESCRDAMVNDSSNNWIEHKVNGTVEHFCPKCYSFNDNDDLVLNTARYKTPSIYSRGECVFHFCPSPNECKEANKCLNG